MSADGALALNWCVRRSAPNPGGAHAMETRHGQFADLGLIYADVTRGAGDCFVRTAGTNRTQDGGMFDIRFVDAVAIDKIESPHDANAVRDALQSGGEFVVAGRRHECLVKRFIERRHFAAVGEALVERHLPDGVERVEQADQIDGRRAAAAELADRKRLDHLAHFVEIVETHALATETATPR